MIFFGSSRWVGGRMGEVSALQSGCVCVPCMYTFWQHGHWRVVFSSSRQLLWMTWDTYKLLQVQEKACMAQVYPRVCQRGWCRRNLYCRLFQNKLQRVFGAKILQGKGALNMGLLQAWTSATYTAACFAQNCRISKTLTIIQKEKCIHAKRKIFFDSQF